MSADTATTTTSTASTWPGGYRAAAMVTINFDGESVEQREFAGQALWGKTAFGRYGAQVGVFRILEALARFDVRATFFIPGFDAERYPQAMAAIADGGHEVAGRGYAYEDFSTLSAEQQEAVLERSEAAFERVFGRRPLGWRAPEGLMTWETRDLLARRGYTYDSTYCDDDLPYVVRSDAGDRIAELPHLHTSASDRHYYQTWRQPWVVAEAWREELSATVEVGGLFNLAIHPRGDYGSGRAVRIRSVEAILQTMHETPGLWVATGAEIAAHALAHAPERVPSP